MTKIHLPKDSPHARQLIEKLVKEYNRKAASVISHTRGHLGELMTTMLFPKEQRNDVVVDKITFNTPYGQRRIDNYHPATKIAVESKNTRVVARKSIRNQIRKDSYLLEQRLCTEITWVLFRGASKRVISLLDNSGIKHISLYDPYFEAVLKNEPDDEDAEIIEA